MTQLAYFVDPATGLAIAKEPAAGYGFITYRCHSCGELIHDTADLLFVDTAGDWIGSVIPPVMPSTMTTHHASHIQEA